MPLSSKIESFCQALEKGFETIPAERKEQLLTLSNYISNKIKNNEVPKLIVICTHNSRRSHMGQLWLAIASDFYQLPTFETFSGGTEATAFNPRAVKAVKDIGIEVTTEDETATNPVYRIKWNTEMKSYEAFSKKYDTPPNPTIAFAAIMVCTSADEGCPVVFGSDFRLSLPFDDPKAFDDTDLEASKYSERLHQIGTEILFAVSKVEK